jgi:hypothetical protein
MNIKEEAIAKLKSKYQKFDNLDSYNLVFEI